ncbi:MAG: SOS response-associated peptidase [Alphaproteobacteria bacterium]
MCGRYALYAKLDAAAKYFGAREGNDGLWDWDANFNIAPATVVPVIAWDGKRQRKIVPMRWGLHPHWKKEAPEGRPLFNARVETASEKPSFRTPFRRRRALMPANGWYEWEGAEKPKTPNYIYEKDRELFAFAALWDQWRVDEGITLLSVTILTTAALGDVKHLHHRMPVRLPSERWDDWLNWDVPADRVLRHMKDGEDLAFHPVGSNVGSGRASGPELIERVTV